MEQINNRREIAYLQYLLRYMLALGGKMYTIKDISIICKRVKLDEKGCHGAPDWVIEIVSPSSKV